MSKRYGNLNEFSSNAPKKQKLQENLDDLWGDDLDANDVDDCFMLASQIYQQVDVQCTQRNNVSILPSYSVFKQTSKNVFTSTQSDPELTPEPTTSQFLNTSTTKALNDNKLQTSLKRAQSFDYSNKDLSMELKFKKLEQQYEAKVGEVGIIRSQLQEIKARNEVENSKQQKEWNEKISVVTKQLKSTESELEFKNLEIVNLTQKLKEVTKINHMDVSKTVDSPFFKRNNCIDKSTVKSVPPKEELIDNEPKLHYDKETYYPLRDIINLSIYKIPVRNMCLNDINKGIKSVNVQCQLFKLQPDLTIETNCKFDVVYDVFEKLKYCSVYELELMENQDFINKLLGVSEHLIKNLLQFLRCLETYVKPDDDNHVLDLGNLLNIKLNKRAELQDEMGIHTTQTVQCVTEIIPHNIMVKKCLSLIPNSDPSNSTYLLQILSLVKLIRKLHISSNFNEFIKAIIKLMNKICLNFVIGELNCNNIIYEITKEIILSVQSGCVLLCLLEYLNNIVLQNNFLVGLCTVSDVEELQIDSVKKILNHGEDICVLQILFTIIEEFLKTNLNYLQFEGNLITFIANSIRCNAGWLFRKEDKCCACIAKVVRLYVNVLYKIVERVSVENLTSGTDEANQCCETLKAGVDALNILNFTLYDVVVKYIATYSQYKGVIKSLLNLRGALKLSDLKVEVLENLITSEVPQIDEEKFKNVALLENTHVT